MAKVCPIHCEKREHIADNFIPGNLLQPHIDSIFQLLQTVYQDSNRTEALLRSSMGVVGDVSEAFPNGEYAHYFRADWLTAMCRETRANKEFSTRTQETARWAREQIKRQAGEFYDASVHDTSVHKYWNADTMRAKFGTWVA